MSTRPVVLAWVLVLAGWMGFHPGSALAAGAEAEHCPVMVFTSSQAGALRSGAESMPGLRRAWMDAAEAGMRADPAPAATIDYEGLLGNDPRRLASIERLGDMGHIWHLGVAHVLTTDMRYAEQALTFIDAWAGVYVPTGNPINENKLEAAVVVYRALREVAAPPRRERIDAWLARMAGEQKRTAGLSNGTTINNWQAKRIKLVGLIALALDDAGLREWTVEAYDRYLRTGLNADGTSRDLLERDALSYHIGGLKPLVQLAIAFDQAGTELWPRTSPAGASVKRSLEYMLPFCDGTKTRGEWVNSKVELDRRRAASGDERYKPGRLFEPKQAVALLTLAGYFEARHGALARRIAGESESESEAVDGWDAMVIEALRKR